MAEETTLAIPGIRKAAIVMISLGQEYAAELLKFMQNDQIEEVSREIAELESITPVEQDMVLQEFYSLAMAQRYMEQGGLSYAQALLEKSLPADQAASILKQVTQTIQQTPFQFLQKAESENVLTFIQDEHPQTIA
ncbi:MAG: flagellar motor switch protein FliG, partial [Planctomycetes bacterium]|nr:flagellar motor switch protein FliG [Planctomycetota bacterium]